MFLKRDNVIVNAYSPDFQGQKIVLGIDPSKSNSGIIIGDPIGNVYHDYEINGEGSENDAYVVAYNTRRQLRNLLKDSEILAVGIEDIITKKDSDGRPMKGMQEHLTRSMITHIFDSYIIFFMDEFGLTPEKINNNSWKASILPEEFRKRYHHKGSKDYYDTYFPGSRWANRKDDVTDAYCIYQFMIKTHKFNVSYSVQNTAKFSGEYEWGFFPMSIVNSLPKNVRKFDYNDSLSIEQMANALATAMTPNDSYVYSVIPISALTIEDFYGDKMHSKFPKNVSELALVISK